MGQLSWVSAGRTDVGRVRSSNQDSLVVDQVHGLFVVADGMGGHAGGEIASQICAETISRCLVRDLHILTSKIKSHPIQPIFELCSRAINAASLKIYERALEQPNLHGMGTTATFVQVVDGHAYCAHVGDSRLYLVRSGFIYQMTSDHSLVSEQVLAGRITEEEAKKHKLKNVITRCVGYQESEYADTFHFALEEHDFIMLCSDGLHGRISNREICKIIADTGLGSVDLLIEKANQNGGDDNITAIVVGIVAT